MSTHCGFQYVHESIIHLNLRMNSHKKRKSGCENSIDHYRNSCKNATFSIQIVKTLPGNAYKNGLKDNAMLEYRLQHEDYRMKTLLTVYS